MKIVTWNCNLNLKKKFEYLAALEPDIAIVQECEQLAENYFPDVKYHWVGQNEKKGLGVLNFNGDSVIDVHYNPRHAFFLPINIGTDGQKLLATWAFNHRAPGRFGKEYKGCTLDALKYYESWMDAGDLIVAGDFNNSVVWDKPRGKHNFVPISEAMSARGLVSAYHHFNGTEYGKETHPTLYHTKKRDKTYHIDYVFIMRSCALKLVTIGGFDDWIQVSDHVPVIVGTVE